ncbi:MAG: DUF2628 domain-containing protein [Proteobacteria bacterium]|nr:DUF2628 domain-containing protein [Pseudomonadota bacterium]
MRVYTVHVRPSPSGEADVVLVKEGFCWPALLLPLLWGLWHGLWRTCLILALAGLALGLVVEAVAASEALEAALGVAYLLAAGVFANDLRRWELGRRGFRLAGVVSGPNREAAERRLGEEQPELFRAGGPRPTIPGWGPPPPLRATGLEDGLWP